MVKPLWAAKKWRDPHGSSGRIFSPKVALPITSFDDLPGKSVNSALNGEIFFLNGRSLFMPLLLIQSEEKKVGTRAARISGKLHKSTIYVVLHEK